MCEECRRQDRAGADSREGGFGINRADRLLPFLLAAYERYLAELLRQPVEEPRLSRALRLPDQHASIACAQGCTDVAFAGGNAAKPYIRRNGDGRIPWNVKKDRTF